MNVNNIQQVSDAIHSKKLLVLASAHIKVTLSLAASFLQSCICYGLVI
jgi:hypothetical protein